MNNPEREIEVKLIHLDEGFESRLLEHGARFDVEEEQINVRVNSTSHPIPDPSYLRVRTIRISGQADRHELTFKRRVNAHQARVNEEFTVSVEDADALLSLLRQVGYDQQQRGRKQRRRYLWEDFRIEFDRWDTETLPFSYVEVEASSPERLNRFYRTFEIPEQAICTESIAELQQDVREGKRDPITGRLLG